MQELEYENRDQQNSNRSCRQRTSDGVSHFEIQGRHQVDLQFSERYNQSLTTNIELDLQNEVSRTTECVPETPHHTTQVGINLARQGNVENAQNPNGNLRDNFYRFQMQFHQKLDSLRMPNMCYICQECYLGMKVSCTS